MTMKTLLAGSISLLAIGLVATPGAAAEKTKVKTKSGNVECTITIEDGETTIEKTVDGKTVKAGKDDKDCSTRLHVAHELGGFLGMNVEKFSGGNKQVRVMMLDGDKDVEFMSEGDKIIFSGGNSPFLSKPGDKVNVKVLLSDKGNHMSFGDGMSWSSSGDNKNVFVRKFGGEGGHRKFPGGMHKMGENGFRFMMHDGDNSEMDLDKDGKVSAAEARSARDTKLKSYDSNNDGRLSLDEYEALWLAKRRAQMVDAFQRLDEDGDAQVTGDEFAASAVDRAKRHERVMRMVEKHKVKADKAKVKSKKNRK